MALEPTVDLGLAVGASPDSAVNNQCSPRPPGCKRWPRLARSRDVPTSLGIVPTMLTRRLATLTEEGLLEKRFYSERPPREEYLLTAAGRDFLPILFMIGAWGRQYRGDDKMSRFIDVEAGTELKPIVVDEVTGVKIGERPIRMVMPDES